MKQPSNELCNKLKIRSCGPIVMVLGPQDLVLARGKDGALTAAGFPLDAVAAKKGEPALILQGGGSGKNTVHLKGLAVPAALAVQKGGVEKRAREGADAGVLPDAIVEQLVALAGVQKPKAKASRKGRKTKRRAKRTTATQRRKTKRRREGGG